MKSKELIITVLDPETVVFFGDLLPAALSGLIDLPETVYLGAVLKDEKETVPAGILCAFLEEGQEAILKWLFVEDDCRGEEIGRELLGRLTDLCEGLHCPSIRAYLPRAHGAFAAETWFEEAGFLGVREEGLLFEGKAEQFKLSDSVKPYNGQIRYLEDLNREERIKTVGAACESWTRQDLPDLSDFRSKAFSILITKGNTPVIELLSMEAGNEILVSEIRFYEGNREETLAAALKELFEVTKGEKEQKLINIYCSHGEQRTLFEKLLEAKTAERIKVISATTEDLRNAERMDEELLKETVDIGLPPLPKNLEVEEIIYYNDI